MSEVKEVWSPRPDDQYGWKEIDLGTGDSSIQSVNDEKKVVFPDDLEPGHKLKLVRSEELWATDPETGECRDLIHRQTYIREASPEEQGFLSAQECLGELLATTLSRSFN